MDFCQCLELDWILLCYDKLAKLFFSLPVSPYGTFPLLEHHGFFLGGTLAIARFLAKRAGMAGDSPEEEATADMVAEQCQEYYDSEWKVTRVTPSLTYFNSSTEISQRYFETTIYKWSSV